jgi:hypothetical protein
MGELSDFNLNITDSGLVALVIATVNVVKRRVPQRYWPILPFAVGWVVSIPIELAVNNHPTVAKAINDIFMQGIKLATLSMAAYKVHRTTIKGTGIAKLNKVAPVFVS